LRKNTTKNVLEGHALSGPTKKTLQTKAARKIWRENNGDDKIIGTGPQGCQMVCFQTKTPNLGKI
jgi:hypothetical protein